MRASDPTNERVRASLRGYSRLRWLALAGHLVALAATWALGFALDVPALALVLAIEVAAGVTTLLLAPGDGRRPGEWLVGLMCIDATVLMGLLYLTGGPHNPMSVVAMVNIAMAAVMLPPSRAWGVTAFTLGLSALLFVDSRPLVLRPVEVESAPDDVHAAHHGAGQDSAGRDDAGHRDAGHNPDDGTDHGPDHGSGHDMSMALHVQGMWAGYFVAGAVIVGFLLRLRRQLDERDEALHRSEAAASRVAQQARLATLAAGAAHELATPLASIAIAADELADGQCDAEAQRDVRVIRQQVARCRDILQRMALGAGQPGGGSARVVRAADLIAGAVEGVSADRLVLEDRSGGAMVRTIGDGLQQALRNLIDNALRAADHAPVRLAIERRGGQVVFVIRDQGPGIPDSELEHVGEPFFTTRSEGQGMGLGVFVARSVAEQLGGGLDVSSTVGVGTVATLRIPEHTPQEAA